MLKLINKREFYGKIIFALRVELNALEDQLKHHLSAKSELEFFKEGRLRMALSDLTENLKELVESADVEKKFNVFRLESTKFFLNKRPDTSEIMMIMMRVPHPLVSPVMIDGTFFQMTRSSLRWQALKLGSLWSETRYLNERSPGPDIDEIVLVKDMC